MKLRENHDFSELKFKAAENERVSKEEMKCPALVDAVNAEESKM